MVYASAGATAAAAAAQRAIRLRRMIQKVKHQRERSTDIGMVNMIKELVGQRCMLTTGTDRVYKGVIMELEENWIKVDTGKTDEMVNVDYLVSIKRL